MWCELNNISMRRKARRRRSAAASRCFVGLLAIVATYGSARAADDGLAYVLLDGHGVVLEEYLADDPRPAPGLAQLLIPLLTLEQVKLELFSTDVPVAVRRESANVRGGVLRLDPQMTYHLEELLRAAIVAGARDAAAVVADLICGNVDACQEMMQSRVALLGMSKTTLRGTLAGFEEELDESSARDLSLLARELLAHPETLRWSSQRGILFAGGPVVLSNTNPLVGGLIGVDGLQVARSGGNCSTIATAERGGMRLIVVVLGRAAVEKCNEVAVRLIDRGYGAFENVELVREGDSIMYSIEVDGGSVDRIAPVATASYAFSQKKGRTVPESLVLRYQLPVQLAAPIARDTIVGELIIERDGQVVAVIPARSPQRVVRRDLF